MGDRITPIHRDYAPQPSQTTPDRDPDGRATPPPPKSKKSRKEKKKDMKKKQKKEDDVGSHVDILAFQIETQRAIHPAISSAFQ